MNGSISGVLTNVGDVMEEAFSWVSHPVSAITDNPLIFIAAVGIPLVGLGIGIVKRLFKLRA